MHKATATHSPIAKPAAPWSTAPAKPAATFVDNYENVLTNLSTAPFTAKGLPVYHKAYGYGFVPHSGLKAMLSPGAKFVPFTSKSKAVKKLGGQITVGKNMLVVDTTHKTFFAFVPAINAAGGYASGLNFPK